MDNGFKTTDLKALIFVLKFILAVDLVDVLTVGGNLIFQQVFEALANNGLRKDLRWPIVPNVLPLAYSTLRKSAITKPFMNFHSSVKRRIFTSLYLGDWVDQEVNDMWMRWSIPSES